MREAQESVDAEEYNWWLAYERLYPGGNQPIIELLAELNASLANIGLLQLAKLGVKSEQKAHTRDDFMPGEKEKEEAKVEKKLPTQTELKLKGMRLCASMGGKFKKKK